MFLIEIRRGLKRYSWKISFLIGIFFVLAYTIYINPFLDTSNEMYLKMPPRTCFDTFIMFNVDVIPNIVLLIIPILSTLGFSDSYFEDKESGIIKSIYTKIEKRRYLCSKFFANFVLGGLAFAVPLLLHIFSLMLIFPSIEQNPVFGKQVVFPGGLFCEYYYEHPLIYILLWIFIYFLYAGIFSSIALAASIFFKSKFSIIIFPFIIYHLVQFICNGIGKTKYSPLSFLFLSTDHSFLVMLGEFLVLLLISFSVFYIGGKNYEAY